MIPSGVPTEHDALKRECCNRVGRLRRLTLRSLSLSSCLYLLAFLSVHVYVSLSLSLSLSRASSDRAYRFAEARDVDRALLQRADAEILVCCVDDMASYRQ